jgi:uncharacterized delta-60 repeat protein
MRRTLLISLTCIAALAGTPTASAGVHLDGGYGRNGIVLLPGKKTPDRTTTVGVAIEPGGGLILATNLTLQRLDPAGRLDRRFGDNGTVTTPTLPGGSFGIAAAAVDGEGRIVVVGTSTPPQPERQQVTFVEPGEAAHSDARILRYLPEGMLDPSFGQGGLVETDLGLPTPEYEGAKLASAPAVHAAGVAVDGAGRIIITGGAVAGVVSGCYHDDYGLHLSEAAFVARLSESGALDSTFGTGGVFGGRSISETPLNFQVAAHPTAAPDGGVLFGRGAGGCARGVGAAPGYVRLGPSGEVLDAGKPKDGGYVKDATIAPDGSTVALIKPYYNRSEPDVVEKLRPDGTPDRAFGTLGKVELQLPRETFANRIRVAPDGEVLVAGAKYPALDPGQSPTRRPPGVSVLLAGLTPQGGLDPRFGPDGWVEAKIPHWYEWGGLWIDAAGRATATAGYRPAKHGPIGFAALRFDLGG